MGRKWEMIKSGKWQLGKWPRRGNDPLWNVTVEEITQLEQWRAENDSGKLDTPWESHVSKEKKLPVITSIGKIIATIYNTCAEVSWGARIYVSLGALGARLYLFTNNCVMKCVLILIFAPKIFLENKEPNNVM